MRDRQCEVEADTHASEHKLYCVLQASPHSSCVASRAHLCNLPFNALTLSAMSLAAVTLLPTFLYGTQLALQTTPESKHTRKAWNSHARSSNTRSFSRWDDTHRFHSLRWRTGILKAELKIVSIAVTTLCMNGKH